MPYKQCVRCVMDTSAHDISFDQNGICNYCTEFITKSGAELNEDIDIKNKKLAHFVAKVKAAGKGMRYDCIVGVSGGVDSSWVLVQAVKHGLRPLAVHMDNGWNSELAQNNIANLVRGLGVDLHTHVIDWDEYRRLMQAFFDADVIDVELLYDNAMLGVNYFAASAHGVKTILGGTNLATEGMRMPSEWNWLKFDKKNIQSIGRRFGAVKLKTFPTIGTIDFVTYEFVRRIKWVSVLNMTDYNKFIALRELSDAYGYKPYPYKHYESVFTRFYQGYILPRKFGVDKRKVHLSTLIVTGQLSRTDAILDLNNIPYPTREEMEADKNYFIKKMGWKSSELDDYISRPENSHATFGTEKPLWNFLLNVYKKIRFT